VDFDPGPGTYNLTSSGDAEIFILKLDANRNFLWAASMGSAGPDNGHRVVVDSTGNVYVSGDFSNTVDFDPGPSLANLTSDGSSDGFVLKLDTNGNYQWAVNVGEAGVVFYPKVARDGFGKLYITGWFCGTVDFDHGPGVASLSSSGECDRFILKLDADGNYQWAVGFGNAYTENRIDLAVDGPGNVYVAGDFSYTMDFDPGPGEVNLTSSRSEIFALKLDTNGNYQWAVNMLPPATATLGNESRDITVDGAGNVYITGAFGDTTDFDPGPDVANLTANGFIDIFVLKLDGGGNYVWAVGMGGIDWDEGVAITTDAAGSIYTTGIFTDTVDFDQGPGQPI
jgi:uncharacterized protein YegP (UPF0339 family)